MTNAGWPSQKITRLLNGFVNFLSMTFTRVLDVMVDSGWRMDHGHGLLNLSIFIKKVFFVEEQNVNFFHLL